MQFPFSYFLELSLLSVHMWQFSYAAPDPWEALKLCSPPHSLLPALLSRFIHYSTSTCQPPKSWPSFLSLCSQFISTSTTFYTTASFSKAYPPHYSGHRHPLSPFISLPHPFHSLTQQPCLLNRSHGLTLLSEQVMVTVTPTPTAWEGG